MNGKQKEFLAKSGINLTDGLVYFSENERLYEKLRSSILKMDDGKKETNIRMS